MLFSGVGIDHCDGPFMPLLLCPVPGLLIDPWARLRRLVKRWNFFWGKVKERGCVRNAAFLT